MTVNKIIKALECCKKAKINQDCMVLKCPFSTEYGCNIGLENLRNEALDLINRKKIESNKYRNRVQSQKGEITRLHKKVAELTAELEEQKAEITVYKVVPKCTARKEGAEKALEEINK